MQPNTIPRVLTPSHVKHYLKQRGIAPLSDVINRFDAPPDAVIAILEFWQQRGMVHKISAQPAAHCGTGGCGSGHCSAPSLAGGCQTPTPSNDLFEWQEPSAPPISLDILSDFDASWLPPLPK
ncbi:MAG: FeoC-like transcriptional regulator [Halothiobacillus sp.]